jgi:hypothetical protein
MTGYLYTSTHFNVLAFNPNDGGNVAPVINLQDTNAQFGPYGIFDFTVDHTGHVLVSTGNHILKFAPLATGNATPISKIIGHYYILATDTRDNIYSVGNNAIVELLSSASGREEPIRRRWVRPLDGFYPFVIR